MPPLINTATNGGILIIFRRRKMANRLLSLDLREERDRIGTYVNHMDTKCYSANMKIYNMISDALGNKPTIHRPGFLGWPTTLPKSNGSVPLSNPLDGLG